MAGDRIQGTRFDHFGISVADLDATIRWYGDMLGFTVDYRYEIAALDARVAFLRLGDVRIEVFEVAGAAALPEHSRTPGTDLRIIGLKHVAIGVDDIDGAVASLQSRGVEFLGAVGEVPNSGGERYVFFRDNSGIAVELFQAAAPHATATAGTGEQDRAIALVHAYYAAFNRGDWPGMLALLADDVVHDLNQGPRETGRAAFDAFLQRMHACYREQLRDIVVTASADGARAAAEYVVHGEYRADDAGLPPARGQRYVLPGGAFFALRDDCIARVSNYYNLQDWIAQVAGDSAPDS